LERYRRLVAEIEAMARASPAEPLNLAALCAAAGISQRTLLRAVRVVHGVSAHRYLQSIRLSQARKMLTSGDPKTATVTQIAMRCGFLELGRFSILYRTTFGETPSETLNRKPARRADGRDRSRSPCSDLELLLAQSPARRPERV
jgi:transcriptional regulator GlxA family with amidase domain